MLGLCWGGGKGHQYGRRSVWQCCLHVVSADCWVKIASLHSSVRNRSWFSESNWGPAGHGLIWASDVSTSLCGSSYHPSPMVHVPLSLRQLLLSADWIGSGNCPNFFCFTELFLTCVIFPVHLPEQLWLCRSNPVIGGMKAPLAIPKVKSGKALYSLRS